MIELTELAPPAVPAVPRDDLMAHLRLGEGFGEPSGEEAILDRYLAAAAAEIEARASLALISRSFRLRADRWDHDGCLTLPVGPVSAIDAASLGEQPLNQLSVGPGTTRQKITRAGQALPPLGAGHLAEFTFTAGFGPSAADVPADLAQAVLLTAAHLYDDRPGGSASRPEIDRLIAPYRAYRI